MNQNKEKTKNELHDFMQEIWEYRQDLLVLAISYLHDLDRAEDILSQAIIKAALKQHQLKDHENLYPWLARIVRNQCCDQIRKDKREIPGGSHITQKYESFLENNDSQHNPQDTLEKATTIENLLDSMLDIKSRNQRELLILYYYHQLNYNEISRELRIPAGTIKSRLSRARIKLGEILKTRQINSIDVQNINDMRIWPDLLYT